MCTSANKSKSVTTLWFKKEHYSPCDYSANFVYGIFELSGVLFGAKEIFLFCGKLNTL